MASILALAAVASMEVLWRSNGFQPSVEDGPALWAYHRARVEKADSSSAIVLLGVSRILTGFSATHFEKRYPGHTVIQLAVGGHSPMAALESLADHSNFTGLVVCEVSPEKLEASTWNEGKPYTEYYEEGITVDSTANLLIGSVVQTNLVSLNPSLRLERMAVVAWNSLRAGRRLPLTPYAVNSFDRFRETDFSRFGVRQYLSATQEPTDAEPTSAAPTSEPETWLKSALAVDALAQRIVRRGAKVVFIRLPIAGGILAQRDAFYPREQYWDQFAAAAKTPTLHFEDVTAFEDIPLPDGSHVDFRDRDRYTDALITVLEDAGLLQPLAPDPAKLVAVRE